MNLRVSAEERQHAMAIISHINGHHQSQRMSTAAHTFATSHSTWRNLRVANNGPCLSQTHAVSCSTLATPCLSQTHAVSCSTLATHCHKHTLCPPLLWLHLVCHKHMLCLAQCWLHTVTNTCCVLFNAGYTLSVTNTCCVLFNAGYTLSVTNTCCVLLNTGYISGPLSVTKEHFQMVLVCYKDCPPLHALCLSTLAKSWYPCLPQGLSTAAHAESHKFQGSAEGHLQTLAPVCREGCHFPMQKSLKMTSRTSSTFTAPVTLPSSRMARRRACAASTLSHCLTRDR